jgi:long-subunit acyl-CoA synthetase (AMP-forming)
MKKLTLAVMLLAGCVVAPGPDAKVKELERKSHEIAARAKQCVLAASKHGNDVTKVPPNGSSSSTGLQARIGKDQRDREISKCQAAEARENEKLSSRERKEYVRESEQERDRDALMMILTTSGPH